MTDDPLPLRPENDLGELLRAVLYHRPYAVKGANATLRVAMTMGFVERLLPAPPPYLEDPVREGQWVMLGRELRLTAAGLAALQEPDPE